MIILYEFVDFIEVVRIKMFALSTELPFDRFGKELCFISVSLGHFVVVAQCWIIALSFWLEEVLDFAPDSFGSVPKLIELQNFSN